MKNQILEVTGATVLQIGKCKITVEPDDHIAGKVMFAQRRVESTYTSNPVEWRIAEAELQRKANLPLEIPTPCKTERIELAPRVGRKIRGITGDEVEIAKVIGRDGGLYFLVDVNGRPIVAKRIDMKWHALPPHYRAPVVGDIILHPGAQSKVATVLGEAEVGGWCVENDHGVSLHILPGEENHWMSMGAVELDE